MPISHKLKCIFVHIPKCAGTSIEKALDIFGDKKENLFGYDKTHKIAMQHLTIGEMLDWGYISEEIYKNYFKFAFIRNPYDRALSSAAYHKISLLQFLRNDPEEFKGRIRHGIPFEWHLRQHLKPQIDYIFHQEKLAVDFVGRYENLEEDWKIAMNKLRIDKSLQIYNQSTHQRYTKYYSPVEKVLVDKLYSKDFELLGYKKSNFSYMML